MTDRTAGERAQIQAEIAAALTDLCETVRIGVIENYRDDPEDTRKSMDLI